VVLRTGGAVFSIAANIPSVGIAKKNLMFLLLESLIEWPRKLPFWLDPMAQGKQLSRGDFCRGMVEHQGLSMQIW
jgi:hypothetical protein